MEYSLLYLVIVVVTIFIFNTLLIFEPFSIDELFENINIEYD